MTPKFKIGQKVKFANDHDRTTGEVLSLSFNSESASEKESGWVYKISSKYFDPELHDMVEGHKICKEEELEDMSDYDGTTDPEKPSKTVNVSDKVKK